MPVTTTKRETCTIITTPTEANCFSTSLTAATASLSSNNDNNHVFLRWKHSFSLLLSENPRLSRQVSKQDQTIKPNEDTEE